MKVLNDVLGLNLKVYQDKNWFNFSIDSVILASFVNIRLRDKKILDIGSGNGIIPLIISKRTDAKILGVEIQKDLVEMAIESVYYNKLDKRINLINEDIRNYSAYLDINSYDVVVSNPPYFKKNEKSVNNLDEHKIIARHEVTITLEEIVSIASKILKNKGIFAMVSRVDRFVEILDCFKKYNLEPKYVRFVYDNINLKPSLFFIEGIKNGKSCLVIDKPFIMFDQLGNPTEEYMKLMGGNVDAK